jgi:hypothetical protein
MQSIYQEALTSGSIPWEEEECSTQQREKLGLDAATTQASPYPPGTQSHLI